MVPIGGVAGQLPVGDLVVVGADGDPEIRPAKGVSFLGGAQAEPGLAEPSTLNVSPGRVVGRERGRPTTRGCDAYRGGRSIAFQGLALEKRRVGNVVTDCGT